MSDPVFDTSSALNTPIRGTTGKFTVSSNESGTSSTEVRYLLTHATLTDTGSNSALMRMLCPVREVFNLEELDFDEIMQRDINDARVAQELIPYLLDTKNSGHVKLFPPIVAVVVPLAPMSGRPAKFYEDMGKPHIEDVKDRPTLKKVTITAGAPGVEHFSFEFYRDTATNKEVEGSATLRLASERVALAIVDGQHRAMALLALFRNLKNDWAQANRQAYEQYYKIWPKSEIDKFKLDELQLPLIICTFPSLDKHSKGELDVVSAARSVFLTLNKNARQVSNSRNQLLDDNDIVSECLRKTLSTVKHYDENSPQPLRIWNMELDQEGEATKIDSEVALSGVSHLYYLAQFLLINNKPISGARPISARGRPNTKLTEAFTRLGLDNALTQDQREISRRNNYTNHVAQLITEKWEARYGGALLEILSRFHALRSFAQATLHLRTKLNDNRLIKTESLLFQGQSSARSYVRFKEMLDARRKDDTDPRWGAAHMEAVSRVFAEQIKDCDTAIKDMRIERAKGFLEPMKGNAKKFKDEDGRPLAALVAELDRLYSDVFTSVAFQAALLITLVDLIERPAMATGEFPEITPAEIDSYLTQLHVVFQPTTENQLKRFFAVFSGDLQTEGGITIVETASSFRNLVYTAEMKPDAFPAYRYVFLEILDRSSWKGAKELEEEVIKTRYEVLESAYWRELQNEAAQLGIPPEKATNEVRTTVLQRVRERYENWLAAVAGRKTDLAKQSKTLFEKVLIPEQTP